jgi:hypothetical protein
MLQLSQDVTESLLHLVIIASYAFDERALVCAA